MQKVIILHKKEGETPLESLEVFRRKHKAYQNIPMTYAGRLDPMASGLLLILAGDECKKKEKYLMLDKEYEFEVLFGFATDTYDILGLVTKFSRQDLSKEELIKSIKKNLKFFKGKTIQTYPVYSSKTVAGKQLWQYGREGQEIVLPTRKVQIKNLKFIKIKKITTQKLLQEVEKRIKKVQGDFRQAEVLKSWHSSQGLALGKVYIASFKIKCTSGTYVRTIASDLGFKLGVPALAFKIKRTKIGKFSPLSPTTQVIQ